MKKLFTNFIFERKKEIKENGLFYSLFVWLIFLLFFCLVFPFWAIGLLFTMINDSSKNWFGGSSNV